MTEALALKYLFIFGTMLVYDFVWASYTLAITKDRVFTASTWAATMPFFIAFFAREYVNDFWTAIPAALGAFVGTFYALKWKKKSNITE